MKKMKRILSLVLILGLMLTCFAGCTKKEKRELYNVNLEKYVTLGEYKGLKVDKKSDEFKKISEDIIRRVTDAARIEDVVGEFVTLRKAGVNLTGICPFHDDKHDGNFIVRPSSVSEKRGGNTYRCFVCDKKGGPVQFLMEHERLSFPDAIRWLGKKYNEPVDDIPLNYTPPPPRPKPAPLPVLEIPRSYVVRTMTIAQEQSILFLYWSRAVWSLPVVKADVRSNRAVSMSTVKR